MESSTIGLVLTVSSILSGAAAFLLGFFLYAKAKVDDLQMGTFRLIIDVLTIPALVIGGITIIAILITTSSWTYDEAIILLIMIASLIPPISFMIMAHR